MGIARSAICGLLSLGFFWPAGPAMALHPSFGKEYASGKPARVDHMTNYTPETGGINGKCGGGGGIKPMDPCKHFLDDFISGSVQDCVVAATQRSGGSSSLYGCKTVVDILSQAVGKDIVVCFADVYAEKESEGSVGTNNQVQKSKFDVATKASSPYTDKVNRAPGGMVTCNGRVPNSQPNERKPDRNEEAKQPEPPPPSPQQAGGGSPGGGSGSGSDGGGPQATGPMAEYPTPKQNKFGEKKLAPTGDSSKSVKIGPPDLPGDQAKGTQKGLPPKAPSDITRHSFDTLPTGRFPSSPDEQKGGRAIASAGASPSKSESPGAVSSGSGSASGGGSGSADSAAGFKRDEMPRPAGGSSAGGSSSAGGGGGGGPLGSPNYDSFPTKPKAGEPGAQGGPGTLAGGEMPPLPEDNFALPGEQSAIGEREGPSLFERIHAYYVRLQRAGAR